MNFRLVIFLFFSYSDTHPGVAKSRSAIITSVWVRATGKGSGERNAEAKRKCAIIS